MLAPLCSHADGEKAEPAAAPTLAESVTAKVQSATDRVVETTREVTESALGLIGVRYKFGGETPDKGLDCSGLVKYVFEHVTGVTLPRRAREQAQVGEQVPIDELQPGDLVFFNTRRASFSHVGIYLGDNQFIHAPHKRSTVAVASIEGRYWKKRFNGARRLVGIMPGMVSIEAAKSILGALPVMVDKTPDK
ncbi:MAG: C40 family peptidase [Betaproteobacteria bacterium]